MAQFSRIEVVQQMKESGMVPLFYHSDSEVAKAVTRKECLHDLQAAIDLPHNRFIVLGLNEAIQSASGCSIDASVHFIQSLEKELGLSLLDKMNVTYRNKNTIDHIPLKEFRIKAKKKQLNPEVIVFNNLVLNIMEYNSLWEGPASSSWHARYF